MGSIHQQGADASEPVVPNSSPTMRCPGKRLLDPAADQFLRLAVGHGDRRVVVLHLRLQVGLEIAEGEAAGFVGGLDGELHVFIHTG